MKQRTITTPEVTDVTDQVAKLVTFGLSYAKNAVNGTAKAVASAIRTAQSDAQLKGSERQISRVLEKQINEEYQAEINRRLAAMRGQL